MPVAAVTPVQAPSTSPPAPTRPPPASEGGSGPAADVSSSASLLSRLQVLAQQDPAALATIANQASESLRTAAASSSGDAARGLTRLADGFAHAAATGDVSGLDLGSPPRSEHHSNAAARSYARSGSVFPQTAAAKLAAVSLQVDEALGLHPPPLGPWGNQ
jgi:hypothetical protein